MTALVRFLSTTHSTRQPKKPSRSMAMYLRERSDRKAEFGGGGGARKQREGKELFLTAEPFV
jgi:hypothetical protein